MEPVSDNIANTFHFVKARIYKPIYSPRDGNGEDLPYSDWKLKDYVRAAHVH
jgi:hypothetical protein